jgi:hypothetical protein
VLMAMIGSSSVVCTTVQRHEAHAWNSVYFALDNVTADGLRRLAAPASKHSGDRSRRHGGFLNKLGCFGSEGFNEVPVSVQLDIANASGEWRRVNVPSNLVAVMVENLPKRWAGGDDFWDSHESGVCLLTILVFGYCWSGLSAVLTICSVAVVT